MIGEDLMLLGAGIMIGAGAPVILRQEYSEMHWSLFWIGTLVAIVGVFLEIMIK